MTDDEPVDDADAGLVQVRRVVDVMGTTASIAAWGRADRPGPVTAAVVRAIAWLREVDDRFTTWRPSEWLRVATGELPVAQAHPDIALVLDRCDALAQDTKGAFDLHAARDRPADPSAFVKGWATQRAADLILEAGAVKVCVYCGGDVVVAGGDRPWRIGVQSPFHPDELRAVIELRSGAVATSGAYERGGHVLDPRTGAPADAWASVTVVGPDLGVADAYSTAAFAGGEPAVAWLRDRRGYGAYLVRPDDSTVVLGMAAADDDGALRPVTP